MNTDDLTITSDRKGDHTTVVAVGEIDLHSAPQLGNRLAALISDGSKDITLDMQGVTFLDTTGLGVLVAGLKRAQSEGGSLDIICSEARVLRVFDLTGVRDAFTIR